MELGSADVVFPDGRGELVRVMGSAYNVLWIIADKVVRMNEVEAWRVVEVTPESFGSPRLHLVPPHVRDLQQGTRLEVEPDRTGVEPAQTWQGPLFAAFRQQLHPKANAKNRSPLGEDFSVEQRDQVELSQSGHGGIEGTDTGQHDLVRVRQGIASGRYAGGRSNLSQHVQNRTNVPHSVVDNCDHARKVTVSAN